MPLLRTLHMKELGGTIIAHFHQESQNPDRKETRLWQAAPSQMR